MKKLVVLLVLLLTIIFSSGIKMKAKTYLDRIDYYEITIDPNKDGTLDMSFNIKWTVLNSTIDGPLTWVKIGIPNKYVASLQAESPNISNLEYYSDNGSYIRVDLDRKYYAGETLEIKFSYIQSRMYHLSGNECYYNYKPGWFDEIFVTEAVVKWNKDGVKSADYMMVDGDYYVWSKSLVPGQTFDVNIKYDQSHFRVLNPDLQYSDSYMTVGDIIAISLFIVIIVIVVVIAVISVVSQQDPYMRERGFTGRNYYYHPRRYYRGGYYSSGRRVRPPASVNTGGFRGGSSGGGSCACACACACAGGGRAGCSMKDFYKHPKLEQIKKALK